MSRALDVPESRIGLLVGAYALLIVVAKRTSGHWHPTRERAN
jgi:predicted MFS family arabinose efflux permease